MSHKCSLTNRLVEKISIKLSFLCQFQCCSLSHVKGLLRVKGLLKVGTPFYPIQPHRTQNWDGVKQGKFILLHNCLSAVILAYGIIVKVSRECFMMYLGGGRQGDIWRISPHFFMIQPSPNIAKNFYYFPTFPNLSTLVL